MSQGNSNLYHILTQFVDIQSGLVDKYAKSVQFVDSLPQITSSYFNKVLILSNNQSQLSGHIFKCISSLVDDQVSYSWNDITSTVDEHIYDNIITYNKLYVCGDNVVGYDKFVEISQTATTGTIDNIYAGYVSYVWSLNGNPYWMSAQKGTYFANPVNLTTQVVNNVSNLAVSNDTVAAIQNGQLYVRTPSGVNQLNAGSTAGSLVGTTIAPKEYWQKVGNRTDWYKIGVYHSNWYALAGDGLSGTLYLAGKNGFNVLSSTQAVPTLTDPSNYTISTSLTNLLTSLTPVTVIQNDNRITPNDWVKAQVGYGNVIALRQGKIYVWGSTINGCIGNGVNYWTDITDAQISAATSGAITSKYLLTVPQPQVLSCRIYASNYNAQTNPNAYSDVVYDDWFDCSYEWYHMAGLRKNSNNQTQVWLWGSNEYGQFGNGNSNNGDSKDTQYFNRPYKLPASIFPYTDAVKVKCTHYGTTITRANGQVYFAGCIKRNNFGMSNYSSNSSTYFITKFTKITLLGDLYTDTYGGLLHRVIPELKDDADPLLKSIFSGDLKLSNIIDAIIQTHIHTMSTSDIDQIVAKLIGYKDIISQVMDNSHIHNNIGTLQKLSNSNGILLYDGAPIASSNSADGAATLTVDPSNVVLDDFATVFGLDNIAGGFPLQVVSYLPDFNTNTSYVTVCKLKSNTYNNYDRWPTVYKKSGTTYTSVIDGDTLRKGGWAVVYTSSAKTATVSSFLMTSIGSYRSFIQTVNKNANYYGDIYALSGMGTWNTTISAIVSNVTKANYNMSDLYYQHSGGLNAPQRYYALSNAPSYSTESENNQSQQYMNVYDSNNNLLVTSAQISAGIYNDNGVKVQWTEQLLTVSGYNSVDDAIIPIYYNYYDNASATGTPILEASAISAGLYKKTGTKYNLITKQDAFEFFDDNLIPVNSELYILPTVNDYTGVANQKYVVTNVVNITQTASSIIAGINLIDYAILKLDSVVINDGSTPDSTSYYPGSTYDPMLAVVASKNRNSTSQAGGQYNAAVGKNATAYGNDNNVFGDQSFALGISNTVAGAQSVGFGVLNSVAGSQSYTFGVGNDAAGEDSFIFGNSNTDIGQTNISFGLRNFSAGNSNIINGSSNQIYGNRNYIVGTRNYVDQNTNDSFILGKTISISGNLQNVYALGINGNVPKFSGNWPADNLLSSMTAAQITGYVNAGTYVSGGLHNKSSLHVFMGDSNTNKLDVMTYSKYKWEWNPAYFATATNSRSSVDSQLLIPQHAWTFTGKMFMNFTTATQINVDSFNLTVRNGGRVKTCDPGLEITDAATTLDFDKAYKFKVKVSGSYVPVLENWIDGAEGYIAIYGGSVSGLTDVSYPAEWTWTNDMPATNLSTLNGFVLIKIMVVDSYIIATNIGTFGA